MDSAHQIHALLHYVKLMKYVFLEFVSPILVLALVVHLGLVKMEYVHQIHAKE